MNSGSGSFSAFAQNGSAPASLTFEQSGLPGYQWSVTLSGYGTQSSSGSTITFTNLSQYSSYDWSVSSPVYAGNATRYVASQASGSAYLSYSSNYVYVSYPPQYYVGFSVSGAGSVSPGSAWFSSGSSVSITAYPSNGSVFAGWTTTGNLTVSDSYSASTTLYVGGYGSVVANLRNESVGVTFEEVGLPANTAWQVVLDGQATNSSSSLITFSFNGSSSVFAYVPDVMVGNHTRYIPVQQNFSFTASSNTTVQIDFRPEYYVSFSVNGSGVVSANSSWYGGGASVDIAAVPSQGYRFVEWLSSSPALSVADSYSNGTTLTVNGFGSLVAVFQGTSQKTLIVSEAGIPQGYTWSVAVNNETGSTTNGTMIFDFPQNMSLATVYVRSLQPGNGTRYVALNQSVSVALSSSVTAVRMAFRPQYFVSFECAGDCSGVIWYSSGWFAANSTLHLGPYIPPSLRFERWNSSGSIEINNATTQAATASINGPGVITLVTATVTRTGVVQVTEEGLVNGTLWSVGIDNSTYYY